MKNNSLVRILVGLVSLSVLVAAVFVCRYSFALRDLRRVQPKVTEATTFPSLAQALVNDTVEYGKRNPAINSLLQSLNPKTNDASAAAGGSLPLAK